MSKNTCKGCVYDTETCNHPERLANFVAFFANENTDVCHTTEETEARSILELVRITSGDRARV